jgi:hypothetical protein
VFSFVVLSITINRQILFGDLKMARRKLEQGIAISERGNYQVNLGLGPLHDWVTQKAARRGCASVPELLKQLAQEAFERENTQQPQPA